jgi:hypothetical protein
MPMLKIPMAATNSPIIPWIQMICGYLRVTKRAQHVVQLVAGNFRWLNLSGTRNTPAFPPISIN